VTGSAGGMRVLPVDPVAAVRAYHERTKHRPGAYAPGPGGLDWATQPDAFRRYDGAERIVLPLPDADATPEYDDLHRPGAIPARAIDLESVSAFFFYSLAISAWKSFGGARWALRVNPSSGNLHPTEAYS